MDFVQWCFFVFSWWVSSKCGFLAARSLCTMVIFHHELLQRMGFFSRLPMVIYYYIPKLCTVTYGDFSSHLCWDFHPIEWFDFSVMMVGDGKNCLICDSSTFLRFFISLVYIPLIQQLIHLILSDGEIFDLCCQQMGYVGGDGF